MKQTLCNLKYKIVAICDGKDYLLETQKEYCDFVKESSYRKKCMFLMDEGRCDNKDAIEFARSLL